MKKCTFAVLLFAALLLNSCKSHKNIAYVQGIDTAQVVNLAKNIASTITCNDVLTITVSAENPEAVAAYNPPVISPLSGTSLQTTPTFQTYNVSPDGYIDYPTLGRIKVEGLTRSELEKYLKDEISKKVNDPIVKVVVTNNKITILGEVNAPGRYDIPNERLTILEALGLARDLGIYAQRENILIIREDENGNRNFIRMDLTKPDIFNSPAFYLKKNDVIYVEPNRYRKSNSTYNAQKSFNLSILSTVISGISVITTMVALLVNDSQSE